MPVDTHWALQMGCGGGDSRSPGRCPPRQLLSNAPNDGQRRRRPAFDAAAMVFARRRSRICLAIVEIGDDSSGFSNLWLWRSAVIKAARFFTVIATRCSLMRPRTRIRYIVGCTYRPLAIC
jgi:hypothetical protein